MIKITKRRPPPAVAALRAQYGGIHLRGDDVRPPQTEVEWLQNVLALVQRQPDEEGLVDGWIDEGRLRGTIPAVRRAEFLGRLESLTAGKPVRIERVVRFPGLSCEPYLLMQEGRIHRRHEIGGGGAKVTLDYALALLLDDDLGLLSQLMRCRFCKKFFLKTVQQRRYCSDECTRIVKREGSARRVAAMRARRATAKHRAEKQGGKK